MNFVDNGRTAKGSDPSAGGSDPFAVHIQNILTKQVSGFMTRSLLWNSLISLTDLFYECYCLSCDCQFFVCRDYEYIYF